MIRRLATATGAGFLVLLLGGTAPSPTAASALAEQVTIRRDTYGVPHILAESEEAAAFGMGYAQGEDHAVEVARRLVRARGESAKFLGTGVEDDFRMKRYGNYEVARAGFSKLTPLFQRMMHAYAAGLNLYIEQNRKSLPPWIPRFDGIDVLARCRAEVMRFAFRDTTIQAVRAKYPAEAKTGSIPSLLPAREFSGAAHDEANLAGSNMWAIAGSRTLSGKPILLGNPHQPWSALYWEAHVTVPGKLNLFGTTYVGLPVLRHGFNEQLGWTHTVNSVDLDDIYALSLDPKSPRRYLFDGNSMPLTRKVVTVEVRKPDGSLRSESRTFWDSHLGPVVHETADKVFAIKSAILDQFRHFEQWYAMGKARNLHEFLEILRMNQLPMFNLTYADVDGNILYVWDGTIPKRLDDGMDYRLDVPGDTGKYVWKEYHRLGDLPQLLNPSGGYVQNCNDPPWWTSLRNPLDRRKYPSYFEPGRQLNLRSQISLQMLEAQQRFTFDEVRKLKFNTRMLLADRIKFDLVQAIRESKDPSDDLKLAGGLIEAWDNRVSADSEGAVLFQRFWDTYRTATKTPYSVAWDPANPARTPSGISDPPLAVRHFQDAVQWTRKNYGSEKVAWGQVHRIRLGSLDLPASGAGGEYGLFRVMQFAPGPEGKRIMGSAESNGPLVGGGDGWIMAVEFTRPVVGYSVLAYGQTSDPASAHATDQAGLFAKHELKRVWFTEEEIESHQERSYKPSKGVKP